jgi:5-methylthioadenosine/S-adenosylhomocysteine deaminase
MPLTETTKIIENGIVATGDSQNRIGPYAVLIRNDRIVDVVPRSEPLKNQFPSAEVIDAKGKVLLPGFIDAHYHGESFLLRHIIGTTPMARWERDRRFTAAYSYLNGDASREDLDSLYRIVYFNALKAGITCIADFGLDNLDFSPTASFEAMKRTEIKGFLGLHNGDQIEKSRQLQSPSIRFAVTITGEDELTTYSMQTALRSADELKAPLMIQLGETRRAQETVKKNFRRTIVQLLNEYHLMDLRVQLSHLSLLEGDDGDVLAAARMPIIVSPFSALLKEVDIPPLSDLLARGIPIALGTDWGGIDPFINIRSLVSIVRNQNRPIPGPFELLAMYTRNSARALGFQDELGSIEPGKKADITFVDVSDTRRGFALSTAHHTNLLSSVLLECSSRDVSDVMINGNFSVRKSTLLTYSEEDLLADGNRLLTKLLERPQEKETRKTVEPAGVKAPILSFETETVQDDADESLDEGFRIIEEEKDGSEPQRKIIPLRIEPAKPVEVPKTIKKVFGEDDV